MCRELGECVAVVLALGLGESGDAWNEIFGDLGRCEWAVENVVQGHLVDVSPSQDKFSQQGVAEMGL
jgi:hypothetical protein